MAQSKYPTPSSIETGWFFQSIDKGDIKNILLFIDTYGISAADARNPSTGQPALHQAIRNFFTGVTPDSSVIDVLLRKRICPIKNGSGMTPVSYAKNLANSYSNWKNGDADAIVMKRIEAYEANYTTILIEGGLTHPLFIRKMKPVFTQNAQRFTSTAPERSKLASAMQNAKFKAA